MNGKDISKGVWQEGPLLSAGIFYTETGSGNWFTLLSLICCSYLTRSKIPWRKTTYCKTIAQMQLLAHIGCYVTAEEAELSIADKILYQAPMSDSIMDAEGRFGTELKRTKDVFFKTTPKSLVILDELVEATTYEEKMEISHAILSGFNKIGNTTMMVTHNHELASRLHQEGKSDNLQVEFKNKKPTYRLIPGIAKESHAELVAEKIGFSSKDIDKYLRKEGYLDKSTS